jgi:hypothetical protein
MLVPVLGPAVAPEFVEEAVPLLGVDVVLLCALVSGARVVTHPERSIIAITSIIFMPDFLSI